mmetsp:Transcript_25451/g.41494  ORF Transcript_25451/g.41494 Transcript_25451/m.41494 type:complete len:340 (+) Transcript_25451:174-1193(+)
MYAINVRLVHALHHTSTRIQANSARAIYASNLDTITRLDKVHQLVVHVHVNRLRRLAVGNILGRLLHLDQLLVFKRAPIVDQLHRVLTLARRVVALGRLRNTTHINRDLHLVAAHRATKERRLNVGNNRRRSNNHAANRDQLIDIHRIHVAHRHNMRRQQIERSHPHIFIALDTLQHFTKMARRIIVHHLVKRRQHFLRERNKLLVELTVKRVQIAAVEVHVPRLAVDCRLDQVHVQIGVVLGKVGNEVVEAVMNIIEVDIGAPNGGDETVLHRFRLRNWNLLLPMTTSSLLLLLLLRLLWWWLFLRWNAIDLLVLLRWSRRANTTATSARRTHKRRAV